MSTATIRILDRLAKRTPTGSDYAVANALGVGRATVSKWRVGKGTMSDDTAVKAAELLGEEPGSILLEIYAERSSSDAAKTVLRQLATRLRRSAAAILAGVVIVGSAQDSKAVAATLLDTGISETSSQADLSLCPRYVLCATDHKLMALGKSLVHKENSLKLAFA